MPVTLIHDRNGGHGCAVFLQLIRVGKRHCRVLIAAKINSDATVNPSRETVLPCPDRGSN